MFEDILQGKIRDVFFNKQMQQTTFEDAMIREMSQLNEEEFNNLGRADDNRIRSLINEHDEYLNKHRPSIGPIVADKKSNILSCKLLILPSIFRQYSND
jgi:hypothetical protein